MNYSQYTSEHGPLARISGELTSQADVVCQCGVNVFLAEVCVI